MSRVTFDDLMPGVCIQGLGDMAECAYLRSMKKHVIREIRLEEIPLLNDFLYEAIFIPEGVPAPPRSIIENEDLQVYVREMIMAISPTASRHWPSPSIKTIAAKALEWSCSGRCFSCCGGTVIRRFPCRSRKRIMLSECIRRQDSKC